jgi:ligand-binding SRPBCC domain-containing protein
MAFYQIIKTQKLPVTISEIWDFISAPDNLKDITPKNMSFIVTSNNDAKRIYPGMIITYKVSPLFGIKLNWMTEITHVKENEYFVDEQRIGPYSMWHHQHKIKEIKGGVLMTDIVTYKPPMGFLGSLMNSLLIKKRLNEIFEYRAFVLVKKFGKFII